jgi:ectoine hydroxylase-related dioxygenase (phytanoyl-CoA dioxygenase family)
MYLTDEEKECYERDGYLAPMEYCSTQEMDTLRRALGDTLCGKTGPQGGDPWGSRHQDCRIVYDICASPAIVDRVSSLLGPDVILWNSVFFNKEPGGREIPWHQDRSYVMMEPVVNVAVWLAIDDADTSNGGLQVVPGSHLHAVPHVPRSRSEDFNARAEMSVMDQTRATPIDLRAGQFILFHENILHHSPANSSNKRRLGLAIRYTVPGVKIKVEQLFEGHFVYPVRGDDTIRANPIGSIPPE